MLQVAVQTGELVVTGNWQDLLKCIMCFPSAQHPSSQYLFQENTAYTLKGSCSRTLTNACQREKGKRNSLSKQSIPHLDSSEQSVTSTTIYFPLELELMCPSVLPSLDQPAVHLPRVQTKILSYSLLEQKTAQSTDPRHSKCWIESLFCTQGPQHSGFLLFPTTRKVHNLTLLLIL